MASVAAGATGVPAIGSATTCPAAAYQTDGGLGVERIDYQFEPAVDLDVLDDRKTELWARLYLPSVRSKHARSPIVVLLHGNHGTCGTGVRPRRDDLTSYTLSGTCPTGYQVVPNHLGYEYLAEQLTSFGFAVLSINANRGITAGYGVPGDEGLNLARGRLVLKHIEALYQWMESSQLSRAELGVDLKGRFDFSKTYLFGHSRGGEGMRAAYHYAKNDSDWIKRLPNGFNIRGIFEVGPVDGQTDMQLDAFGTNWGVLLPYCDGDVSTLAGNYVFDRQLARPEQESTEHYKAVYSVWGANHNFFNTEWQQSDAVSCFGQRPLWSQGDYQSIEQQQTLSYALLNFLKGDAWTHSQRQFGLHPRCEMPAPLNSVTRVDRTFLTSLNRVVLIDDMDDADLNSLGLPRAIGPGLSFRRKLSLYHDMSQFLLLVNWRDRDPNAAIEFNLSLTPQGFNLSEFSEFFLRLYRSSPPGHRNNESLSPDVAFRYLDGSLSQALSIADYISLVDRPGLDQPNESLSTVQIPVDHFRLTGPVQSLIVSFAGLSADSAALGPLGLVAKSPVPGQQRASLGKRRPITQASGVGVGPAVRPISESPRQSFSPVAEATGLSQSQVELRGRTYTAIEVDVTGVPDALSRLLKLKIGDRIIRLGGFPRSGLMNRYQFLVEDPDLARQILKVGGTLGY